MKTCSKLKIKTAKHNKTYSYSFENIYHIKKSQLNYYKIENLIDLFM